MVLRPATVEDLPRLDELDAFYGASKITGKDAVTERAIMHVVCHPRLGKPVRHPPNPVWVIPESRRTIIGPY